MRVYTYCNVVVLGAMELSWFFWILQTPLLKLLCMLPFQTTLSRVPLYYTRKNARSVTAFSSTDIRSVRDNVATPVTAMMVTVCISTDALSSVFISPDLSDTNSFHQCCWSIMPVLIDCNSLFPTYLYHSVTSD